MRSLSGTESAYRCQFCGEWFIRGNTSCTVLHGPMTCCHHGDIPCDPPRPRGSALLDDRAIDLRKIGRRR